MVTESTLPGHQKTAASTRDYLTAVDSRAAANQSVLAVTSHYFLSDFLEQQNLGEGSEKITQCHYDEIKEVRSNIVEVNDLAGSMRNISAAIQYHEKA